MRLISTVVLLIPLLYSLSCSLQPIYEDPSLQATYQHTLIAKTHQFKKQWVSGKQFDHLIFTNAHFQALINTPKATTDHTTLLIFIEGDGLAWVDGKINQDPTPYNPLMLKLMSKAQQPALYLGRPCYFQPEQHNNIEKDSLYQQHQHQHQHQQNDQQNDDFLNTSCHPKWWTSHRYAPEVVESMLAALNRITQLENTLNDKGSTNRLINQWVLMGHSGGGTLSLLLGTELDSDIAIQVITLAGNIQPSVWIKHHGYTPLLDSPDPSDHPHFPQLQQFHFMAKEDTHTPNELFTPLLNQHSIPYTVIDQIDHSCCWLDHWKTIQSRIKNQKKTPN